VRGLHTLSLSHITPLHNLNDLISNRFNGFNVPAKIRFPILPVLPTHFPVRGLRIFSVGHGVARVNKLCLGEGDVRLDEVRLEEVRLEEVRLEEVRLEEVRLEEVRLEDVRLEDVRLEDVRLEDVRLEDVRLEDVRLDLRTSSSFPARVSGLIHLKLVPEHILSDLIQSLSVLHLLIY